MRVSDVINVIFRQMAREMSLFSYASDCIFSFQLVSHEKNRSLLLMGQDLIILLIEDNFEHIRLTKYILREQKIPGEVLVVRDGQEAVDYFYRRNEYADAEKAPRPNLVLLDLNIPCIDGKELLRMLKEDNALKEIPVVVMSSSDREEDMAFANEMGAASYISKSDGFEKLTEALASIPKFAANVKD